MKQGFGDILHAQLGEETSLASLDGIHRLAHSVGNVIHRIALGRQPQHFSLGLAQGYTLFFLPLVFLCGILIIPTISILLHDDVTWLISCGQRYGAESKPNSSVFGKKNRGKMMVDESALPAIDEMKIIRNSIFQPVLHWQLIEEVESFLVHLQQHLQVVLWHMVDINLITCLHELIWLQATEISQIVGGIDKVLVEIIDDIHTLISAASKSLCCIHQSFYLAIILLGNVVHLVGMEEKVILVVVHNLALLLPF